MKVACFFFCACMALVLFSPVAQGQDTEDLKPFEKKILNSYKGLAETAKQLHETEQSMAELLCYHYTRTVSQYLRKAKNAQEEKNRSLASDHLHSAAEEARKLMDEGGETFGDLRRMIYWGRGASPTFITGTMQRRIESFARETERIAEAIAPSRFVKPGRQGDIDRLMAEFKTLSQDLGF